MNFFEKELRNLVRLGIAPESSQASFIGRTCYLTLSGDRRARLKFTTCGTADSYAALTITILNSSRGTIDGVRLRFEDYFAEQISTNAHACGSGIQPHIWVYQGEASWYRNPATAEYKPLCAAAKEYIGLFK